MTELLKLIEESRNKEKELVKKELVATTVRMPIELQSFVEELAEYLNLSKQDAVLKLIEEGVEKAREALELDVIEEEKTSKYHILNTNKKNNASDGEMMLDKKIAAAFYDPWKNNISRIQKGDVVFLYENGKGMVAYGYGTGNTLKKDYCGGKDECYYQKLDNFVILKTPLSAREIKKILNRNVVFLRTMAAIPDGKKVLDRISSSVKQ